MLAKSLLAFLALNAKLAAADDAECVSASVLFFTTCFPFLDTNNTEVDVSMLMSYTEIVCTNECNSLVSALVGACGSESASIQTILSTVCTAYNGEPEPTSYCDMKASVMTACGLDEHDEHDHDHDHGDEDDDEEEDMDFCTTQCGEKLDTFIGCGSPMHVAEAQHYKTQYEAECDACFIAMADLYTVDCPAIATIEGDPPLEIICTSSCKPALMKVEQHCRDGAPNPADYPPGPNGTQPEIPENDWSWVLDIPVFLAQCPEDGVQLSSPPPPAPPISPAISSEDVEAKVMISLLLDMPLSACNSVFKVDTCKAFAERSGVNPNNCDVACSEASRRRLGNGINVDITLAVINPARAAAIRSKLASGVLSSKEAASELLGVPVLAMPVLDLAAPAPPPLPPSPPPSPPPKDDDSGLSTGAIVGIAVGAGIGGLVIVALIAFCLKSSKGGGKQTYPAA